VGVNDTAMRGQGNHYENRIAFYALVIEIFMALGMDFDRALKMALEFIDGKETDG